MPGLVIRDAEVEGVRTDVRVAGGRVRALGTGLEPAPGDAILPAEGGALLPGLHDHHLHLLAWAKALASVACGPPAVRDAAALGAALRAAAASGRFVRGVGYHESVAGALDRGALDALAPGAAVRVQHRSGALWVLSSEACRQVGLDAGVDGPGVERDAAGRATGRLFRLDAWLRARLGREAPPALDAVGGALARFGVTGATDATPDLAPEAVAWLAAERARGALPQDLVLLGATPDAAHGIPCGPAKLVLDERALPSPEALAARIRRHHEAERAVAIHCVTRAELVLALAALEEVGVRPGDRIEHASVAPPELAGWLARLGVAVVTQPGFVRTRGDDYLRDVEAADQPWLYRCAGFEAAGVALGAGSDAPFGEADPWLAMQAAIDRRTARGATLGSGEALSPERALVLFSTPWERPGGAPRRVVVGAPADLCLLDRPWSRAREALSSTAVAATLRAGTPIYRRA